MKLVRSAVVVGLLSLVVAATNGCAKKPTMTVRHAEMQGMKFGFPPSVAVQMTVVMDVFNPNSYDVAIRAMRGTVTFHDRYTMPIDFQPGGEGIWLGSDRTTQVRVPTTVPVDLALRIAREAMTGTVPYRVVGKADVTATRSLKIESDDYSVDERGQIARQQIEASIAALGMPFLR
ncbi:MAG: LEA type 2 family protein [Labilithrix sp.]|nr:LEA type 2 family protein [Labilithrix sp.]MBX3213017.1 LEA type 2 family protein [Labilithrix sp.]